MLELSLKALNQGSLPSPAKREIYRRLHLFPLVLENQFICEFDKAEAIDFYVSLTNRAKYEEIPIPDLLYKIHTEEKDMHVFIHDHFHEWQHALCYLAYGSIEEEEKVDKYELELAKEGSLAFLKFEMNWVLYSI